MVRWFALELPVLSDPEVERRLRGVVPLGIYLGCYAALVGAAALVPSLLKLSAGQMAWCVLPPAVASTVMFAVYRRGLDPRSVGYRTLDLLESLATALFALLALRIAGWDAVLYWVFFVISVLLAAANYGLNLLCLLCFALLPPLVAAVDAASTGAASSWISIPAGLGAAVGGGVLGAYFDGRRAAAVRSASRAVAAERRQLARELHDGVASSLVALKHRGADDPAAARLVDAALAELRGLGLSLSSEPVTAGDAIEALERLCRVQLGAEGTLSFRTSAPLTTLSAPCFLFLSRFMQEGIANLQRHGVPATARLELQIDARRAYATIANDVAADSAATATGLAGNGVRNLIERARELGGVARFELAGDRAVLSTDVGPGTVPR